MSPGRGVLDFLVNCFLSEVKMKRPVLKASFFAPFDDFFLWIQQHTRDGCPNQTFFTYAFYNSTHPGLTNLYTPEVRIVHTYIHTYYIHIYVECIQVSWFSFWQVLQHFSQQHQKHTKHRIYTVPPRDDSMRWRFRCLRRWPCWHVLRWTMRS